MNAEPRQRVLEAGNSHGAAAICLARRVPACHVTGIEIQPDAVRLANENARLNGLAGKVQVMVGDLRPLPRIAGGFDHAMANPPFLDAPRADGSPVEGRVAANVEGDAKLGDWIGFLLGWCQRYDHSHSPGRPVGRNPGPAAWKRGRNGCVSAVAQTRRRQRVSARKGIRTPLTVSSVLSTEDDGTYTERPTRFCAARPILT